MTQEEIDFANDVSEVANRIIYVAMVAGPMIGTAACIEACMNIASENNKHILVANKLRVVADMLEAKANATN